MNMQDIDILLVEDDSSDAELAKRALKKSSISNHLVHLKDGEEALDFIYGTGLFEGRNTSKKPKVIFLDLKMPKVNGIEVLKKIKEDEQTRSIPVVVLTSSKESKDIQECYRLGVNSYIVKPMGFENFTTVLNDLGIYWAQLNNSPS